MKKISTRIALLVMIFGFMFVFAACGDNDKNPSGTDNTPHTHAFGEWEQVTAPTCTVAGSKKRVCSCGETETDAIAASGHSFGEWSDESESTCTVKGLKKRTCSVCGTVEEEDLDLASHKFTKEDAAAKYLVSAATCTAKAVYKKSCSECGAAGDETFTSGGFANHNFIDKEDDNYLETDGDCDTKAVYYKSCKDCGAQSDETFVASDVRHKFTAETVDERYLVSEATCIAYAVYKISCSECGAASPDKTFTHGNYADHRFGEWQGDPEATCTTDGLDVRTCVHCGEKETKEVEAFGHDFEDGECSICGKRLGDGLKFALTENGEDLTVTGYEGTDTDLVIPEVWKDPDTGVVRKVVAISEGAMSNIYTIHSLTVPKSVTSIGFGSLPKYNLTKLTIPFVGATLNGTENTAFGYVFGNSGYVDNIPRTLKEVVVTGGDCIAREAFDKCTFDSLTILDGVTSVEAAFNMSKLGRLVIPNSVTKISRGAFNRCDVTELSLPFIGETADATENTHLGYLFQGYFFGTTELPRDNENNVPAKLTSLAITGQTKIKKKALYGCKGIESLTLGEKVTVEHSNAFLGLKITYAKTNSSAAYYLPKDYLKTLVITKGYSTGDFQNCTTLTDLTLEEGATNIDSSAFKGCTALANVTLPSTLKSIYSSAFEGCTALADVILPSSLTYLGVGAFKGCTALSSIALPDSLTKIFQSAFEGCGNLTDITLPASLTEIEKNAFADCENLKKINIEDVGAWFNIIFWNAKANPLYYARNLYLDGEKVTSAETPESATAIKRYAFYNCEGLKNITIRNGIQYIYSHAFYNCVGLTEVTVPASVELIEESVFSGCDGLTKITLPFVGEKLNNTNPDPNLPTTTHFGYIFGAESAKGVFEIPGQMDIKRSKNSDCVPASLKEVVITGGEKIDYSAFYGCNKITKIVISGNVTEIGSDAFQSCSELTSITLPASLTEINYGAFWGCSKLVETHISDLDAWCNIWFGNTLSNPLSYSHNLYLNGELVTEVTVPSEATRIRAYAFYSCDALTSVSIPDGVINIYREAFKDCSALTRIDYSGTVAQWNAEITKYDDWDAGTGDYTVYCTDGTVDKDGTVTMNE